MDPASAFAVAVNAIQLLDYSIKVIGVCGDVYKAHGELPDEFNRTESLATDLLGLMQRLKQQSQATTANTTIFSEPTFQALVDGCLAEIQDLRDLLDSLKTTGSKLDPLNLRTSIRTLRKSGKIARIAAKLEQYRDGISARLIESTHERQQYVCQMVDRNRTESAQASTAIQDALDLLKSSITNTSTTISTDVSALMTQGDDSRSSIQSLLQEVKVMSDQVEGLRATIRTSPRPQQVVRMRPVLQLQSARNRKRVRIRSGTNQDPTWEKSNSSRRLATEKSRDGERRPTIKFTLSVAIYGDPRDLVSFVRSMFFSSWTNVVQPIAALLSPNTIPTTIDFSAPTNLDLVTTMLQQRFEVQATYDATTGILTVSNNSNRIIMRTQRPSAESTADPRFQREALWNLFHALPSLESIPVPDPEPPAQPSAFTEYLQIENSPISYLAFLDTSDDTLVPSDDASSPSEPESSPQPDEEVQISDPSQTQDLNKTAPSEATEIDFSSAPTAMPVIKESSIYANNLLTGKVLHHRTRSTSSTTSTSSHSRPHKRRRRTAWYKPLLILLAVLSTFLLVGYYLDSLDGGWTFQYFGLSESANLRQWMYTDGEGRWIYRPTDNVEEHVTEEVKMIHEDRKWRKRRAREKKMRERAYRCQTWGLYAVVVG